VTVNYAGNHEGIARPADGAAECGTTDWLLVYILVFVQKQILHRSSPSGIVTKARMSGLCDI
jgi:hypothetical protein